LRTLHYQLDSDREHHREALLKAALPAWICTITPRHSRPSPRKSTPATRGTPTTSRSATRPTTPTSSPIRRPLRPGGPGRCQARTRPLHLDDREGACRHYLCSALATATAAPQRADARAAAMASHPKHQEEKSPIRDMTCGGCPNATHLHERLSGERQRPAPSTLRPVAAAMSVSVCLRSNRVHGRYFLAP
jgi:hypothetical protein